MTTSHQPRHDQDNTMEFGLMRTLTLIYHEDLENDITLLIERLMVISRYTRIRDVIGARADSLERANMQPQGHNNMLIIVAEQAVIHQLVAELQTLRKKKGHGLRGYVMPVEEVI